MLNYQHSLDEVFHALSDSTRRGIVERLAVHSATVKELAEPFDMSLPAVMLHLQILEAGGITSSRKVGRVRTCWLNQEPLLLIEGWLEQRKATWNRLFDNLENLIDEEGNDK